MKGGYYLNNEIHDYLMNHRGDLTLEEFDPVLTHYCLVVQQVADLETIYDKLATADEDLEAIDLK